MSYLIVALLVVAPAADWIVTLLLLRAWRRFPDVKALRERALMSVGVAVFLTCYVLAAFNAMNGYSALTLEQGQLVARLSVSAIGLAASVYWLWLYGRGRF